MDEQDILKIQGLSVEFRTDEGVTKAINDLDLDLRKGETLGLVGETGAGKTTTGLSILRLVPSPPGITTGGSIQFNGESIRELPEKRMHEIRGAEISMIFQDPMTSLNPVIVVEDQIAEIFEFHHHMKHAAAIEEAHRILEMVGIPATRGGEYPHQFSGGMKQRVVIAMALAGKPKLLIADEPTTALDVTIQAQVLDMMAKLKDELQMAMLMITHDLGIVAEVCDRVAIMYAGHVVETGTLEEIFDHTLHPYTEGLFNSLPKLGHRGDRLEPIPGLMPDPTNLPGGCPFHPRCKYATERCKTEKPSRVYRNEQHYVECHLYNEENIQSGGVINRGKQ